VGVGGAYSYDKSMGLDIFNRRRKKPSQKRNLNQNLN